MRDTTTAAPPMTWSRAFPANPAQVREVRRFLADILDGRQAADDAVLCLSELAANATIHSRSHLPGGRFTVCAMLLGDRLRVEVRDQGGPWNPLPRDEPNGRGFTGRQRTGPRVGPQRRQHWPDRLVRDGLPLIAPRPDHAAQVFMEHS
jgi:hypothetical protein